MCIPIVQIKLRRGTTVCSTAFNAGTDCPLELATADPMTGRYRPSPDRVRRDGQAHAVDAYHTSVPISLEANVVTTPFQTVLEHPSRCSENLGEAHLARPHHITATVGVRS